MDSRLLVFTVAHLFQISVSLHLLIPQVMILLALNAGVSGGDISTEHCRVEYKGHRVTVHPLGGDCFINHKRLRKPTKLSQGIYTNNSMHLYYVSGFGSCMVNIHVGVSEQARESPRFVNIFLCFS